MKICFLLKLDSFLNKIISLQYSFCVVLLSTTNMENYWVKKIN